LSVIPAQTGTHSTDARVGPGGPAQPDHAEREATRRTGVKRADLNARNRRARAPSWLQQALHLENNLARTLEADVTRRTLRPAAGLLRRSAADLPGKTLPPAQKMSRAPGHLHQASLGPGGGALWRTAAASTAVTIGPAFAVTGEVEVKVVLVVFVGVRAEDGREYPA